MCQLDWWAMNQPIDVHDQKAYDALQAKLIPLWKSIERFNTDEQTIVVVPSADVDVDLAPSVLQAYEERYLFLLFLLRQPRARMVYVTGQAIHPNTETLSQISYSASASNPWTCP